MAQPVFSILFQATPSPAFDGVSKPMKPGGYRDSSADIAWGLVQAHKTVVTPKLNPDPEVDDHWSFPDTLDGIEAALSAGATVLWANTVLFSGHPIERFRGRGLSLIGPDPKAMETIDDKFSTACLLRQAGLPVPHGISVGERGTWAFGDLTSKNLQKEGITLPCIVKPVRGRGSTGVRMIGDESELAHFLNDYISQGYAYGNRLIIEEYLPGKEATITVLPPGRYHGNGQTEIKKRHWFLPPIERFAHEDGILPYSGKVPVIENSRALSGSQLTDPTMQAACEACAMAGNLLGARAVMRIDIRQDRNGIYRLFDMNAKPNMTASGRPGREGQDSLVTLAARSFGWEYPDLLSNLADQAWPL